MEESNIDIGVLEERSSWLLHPRFFPSKVGGKPAWLDLKNLPAPAELTCKLCEEPLIFLCQVYAPYEESDLCFHRTIFIFICKNGRCCANNTSDNFVVLRCQLPRRNEFYSFEPYKEIENEVFPMDVFSKLCSVCGAKGTAHCSKCKSVFYCSRKHQILDWQKGHKTKCQLNASPENTNFIVTEAGKSLLFKEWDLQVDAEDEEEATQVDENKEIEKLHKMMQEKQAGTLTDISENELEQYTQSMPEDKVFKKFSKRVARHPEQVMRYDRSGAPLWITGTENSQINIPRCEYCQGERQFEFQIMPQLLNFIDAGVDLNSIDWGVLVIYTCKKSCGGEPAYKKEYVVKQDIVR